MKVTLEVITRTDAPKTEQDVLRDALSIRILSMEKPSVPTDTFMMEAYDATKSGPVYTRKQIMDSGATFIQFPDGMKFKVAVAIAPMPVNMKVMIVQLQEPPGQWLMVAGIFSVRPC
jgi:hypothetical protein